MRRSSQPWALAAAAYAVLTLALTWPLALAPRTLVPSDLGDPLLVVWFLWWNATTLPLSDTWWNAPQFYPFPGVMGLSEHLLGLTPITTPIILLTREPVLAYSVAFLLSFVLSGLSAHFLVFTLTRRHDLSLVAGLAFAFAPFRMAHIAHLHVLSSYWMPFALAALHRSFAGGPHAARWAWTFAAAWLMQALACGYYFFFLSVLVAAWLVWFGLRRGKERQLVRVLAAWTVAAILSAPLLYGYWRISRTYNLRRSINEIRQFSGDILSVLKSWHRSLAWGWLDVVDRPEAILFPGLTVVILTVWAVAIGWRRAARGGSGYLPAARALLALGLVATTISAIRMLRGPFRIEIGDVLLLSVTSPEKPVSLAVLCFVAAALLHPAVRFAWRRQSTLAFYVLAAGLMWLMALGPEPTLMNVPALYKAPYAWLLMLPGADGIRVPVRFWMLAALCLAVAAALGLRLIMQRFARAPRWLPALAAAGVLIDGWPQPFPMARVPDARPTHTSAAVRLDLPVSSDHDPIALYRSIQHRRPIINGYSGYFPPHYWVMSQLLKVRDPNVLTQLSELGSLEIMVEHALDPDGAWRAFVAATPNARLVQTAADYTTYEMPQHAGSLPVQRGSPLPITVSDASVNLHLGPSVHDGDLLTRWFVELGAPRPQTITIALSEPTEVKGIELLLGGYSADYPDDLMIEASGDRQSWVAVWRGPTAGLVLAGALKRPRHVPISIPLPPHTARFVRLSNMRPDPKRDWSVAELRVLK